MTFGRVGADDPRAVRRQCRVFGEGRNERVDRVGAEGMSPSSQASSSATVRTSRPRTTVREEPPLESGGLEDILDDLAADVGTASQAQRRMTPLPRHESPAFIAGVQTQTLTHYHLSHPTAVYLAHAAVFHSVLPAFLRLRVHSL